MTKEIIKKGKVKFPCATFKELLPNFRHFHPDTANAKQGQLVWMHFDDTDSLHLAVIEEVITKGFKIGTMSNVNIDCELKFLHPKKDGEPYSWGVEGHTKYTVYTDDILNDFEMKGIRKGSKVYIQQEVFSNPTEMELFTVEDASHSDYFMVTAYDEDPLQYRKNTYGCVNSPFRAYPKDLIEKYAEVYGVDTTVRPPGSRAPLSINKGIVPAANALLSTSDLPDIRDMIKEINEADGRLINIENQKKELSDKLEDTQKKLKVEKAKMAKTTFALPEFSSMATNTGSTKIPAGEVTYKKAYEVFKTPPKMKSMFDFDLPVWEWYEETTSTDKKTGKETVKRVTVNHPHVPEIDKHYIHRPKELLTALWALTTNQKAWISGHTGTGKSTLVEQIAANLNWPMIRVNFDSEITRMDLIGREVLSEKDGVTVSTFVDGILPQAMQGPNILLCDEIDFVRPEVAYVMQRALEDKGLMVTEDGGRLITPDPMFRIIATANTNGQGDDYGQYQGARNQSMAFLDRFTVFIDVGYLEENQEKKLLKARVEHISDEQATTMIKYVREHRTAFTGGEIMQPLSPRGVTALGRAIVTFGGLYDDEKEGLKTALEATILNRSNPQDRNIISGIVDRVFSVK